MEQRTPEWFDARKGMVTGSRVGAILGFNPLMKREDVMQDMLGNSPDLSCNPAVAWGNSMEDTAIRAFENMSGLDVFKAGFVVHPDYDWLGASPDGYIGSNALIEVKCPYSQAKRNYPEFKRIADLPHYYAQIQIQMYCTGAEECNFYQWAPNGSALEIIPRNDGYIASIMPQLEMFYDDYLARLNEKDTGLDTVYLQALATYESAKEALDKAKGDLVRHCNGNSRVVGKVNVSKVEKQGSVSYAKVVKEHLPGLDLESYRGKPTSYWKVSTND